jgi:Copper transport outer membrane protein, MctB
LFDFRYHALSLVAVFLALGIGIVLGVTIGDSLVSEADRSLRRTLRGDVLDAREDERRARDQIQQRDDLIGAAFPLIAGDRLRGERVAIVATGDVPGDVEDDVRDAVEEAGGELSSVTELTAPPDLEELGDELGRRFEDAAVDEDAAGRLGRRLGRSILAGGRITRRLSQALPDRFQGDYRGADAVVVWRTPGDEPSDAAERFEVALLEEMAEREVPIVGVERSDSDPSQIGFYSDHGLSSVDSVDLVGGRAALVLALDGAEGRFGFKESAEDPLPREG